jgi:hypothetical protein
VFTREFPEVWRLAVDAPLDGYDEPYQLVGLFNWGRNFDMTVSPYAEMADDGQPRHLVVDLAAQGLEGEWLAYEFWTEQFLGLVQGELDVDVPAHSARVVALRHKTGAPQFLGWNRQITMGGTLVEAAAWDPASRELRFRSHVAAPTVKAPFTYSVAFYVPDGFVRTDVRTEGVAVDGLEATQDGQVLTVRFVPNATGDLTVVVPF